MNQSDGNNRFRASLRFSLQKLLKLPTSVMVSVFLLITLAAGLVVWHRPGEQVPPVPIPPPPTDADQFVGNTSCTRCHRKIAEQYASHPMSHTVGALKDLPTRLDQPATVKEGPFNYVVEPHAGGMRHYERLVDGQGRTLTDQSVEVSGFIGSGHMGHSFYTDRGGLLFQTPISWFTKISSWGLAPGYVGFETKFERQISEACLNCHAGRVAIAERDRPDRFLSTPLLEPAIGCERCHGPGKRHVTLMDKNGATGSDLRIVNPQKLASAQREAICYQCHLATDRVLRYGRRHVDFRPGMSLEDVWAVTVPGRGEDAKDSDHSVGHVTQMWRSRCFQASGDKLGCISCHDPHSVPKPEEEAQYYRQHCLTCHSKRGCKLDLAERQKSNASDSCIACHMPRRKMSDIAHGAQTDHRILRRPETLPGMPGGRPSAEIIFSRETEKKLSTWELQRSRGLVIDLSTADEPQRQQAIANLEQALAQFDQDVEALVKLAKLHILKHEDGQAQPYLERAIQFAPKHEEALGLLGIIMFRTENYAAGLKYTNRLLELNPWLSEKHADKSIMLALLGDVPGAIRSLEMALELNPTLEMRNVLPKVYEMQQEMEKANQQRKLLQAIETVLPSRKKQKDIK